MPEISLGHSALKQRHRLVRDGHPTNLSLRIHRALSWLNRAEQSEDMDGKFIFLWIAFNAAYAQELDDSDRTSDKATFTAFLQKLCDLDTNKHIDGLIWKEFSGSIRTLLDNPYVFHFFWEFQRGRIGEELRQQGVQLAIVLAQHVEFGSGLFGFTLGRFSSSNRISFTFGISLTFCRD